MIKSVHAARNYCCEDISLIENYDLAVKDRRNKCEIHHRLEIGPTGRVHDMLQLCKLGLYTKRPASELMFIKHSDHVRLHWQAMNRAEADPRWTYINQHHRPQLENEMALGHDFKTARKRIAEYFAKNSKH